LTRVRGCSAFSHPARCEKGNTSGQFAQTEREPFLRQGGRDLSYRKMLERADADATACQRKRVAAKELKREKTSGQPR